SKHLIVHCVPPGSHSLSANMIQFAGSYKHEKDDNFEAILNKQGFNFVLRKMLGSVHPSVEITVDGKKWTIVTTIPIKSVTHEFIIDEEIELESPDGKKQKVIFTLEGNTLTQKQLGDKKDTIVERRFAEDGIHMKITHIPSGTVGTRYFKRVL
ncbi:unnamed protein product, partial [Meganyctiphanes norvegica]